MVTLCQQLALQTLQEKEDIILLRLFFFVVVVVVCAQINENVLTNNFFPAFSGSASSANGPAEGVDPLLHVVDA